MFKKIASDALGLSDIGTVIAPSDYDKVDTDDYIFHEDDEKIYFLIKSKTDEYCFTNRAFIHLDGTSAMSKKRMLKRYEYHAHSISHVMLETAGTIDLDVEIKFVLGGQPFSIDINKKQIEKVKDLYKALTRISEVKHENDTHLEYASRSLDVAKTYLTRGTHETEGTVQNFKDVNNAAFEWLSASREKYVVKDFGFVFEKYINQ